MRYESKPELIGDIERQFDALCGLLVGIPRAEWTDPGVWGDDWSVNDLLAHLSAWHRLFLGWHREGHEGRAVDLPAPGYKWNETPRLNRDLWERLSPWNKVRRITTPTMWVCGEEDWNVPVLGSEHMYMAAKRLGREALLVVYPGEDHSIDQPSHVQDLSTRYVAWFDRHLEKDGGDEKAAQAHGPLDTES